MPLLSAVVLPRDEPSAKSSTVLPVSAVPLKVGVVSSVTLSVSEMPVSEAAIRSGVDGAAGGVIFSSSSVPSSFPVTLLTALPLNDRRSLPAKS